MQVRPVLHAAALAAAMLFAAGASAQQSPPPLQSPKNPAAPANNSGGTASPEMKAKAEHLKQSIRHGTHELHEKVDSEMAKSKKARANDEDVTWKSEHEKSSRSSRSSRRGNESTSAGNGGNGMGSASFRRAMSRCTDNENLEARAECAREAVAQHGGSSAS